MTDTTGQPLESLEGGTGFGADMERLEAIVARLEGDESLGLEEAMALYQQGVALAGACRQRLAGAQLTLTELPVRPLEEVPPEDAAPEDAPPEDGPDGPEAGR
jgi:exodeoxyribonuclease VII small subunit